MLKDSTDDRGASENAVSKDDEFEDAFNLAETGNLQADESAANAEVISKSSDERNVDSSDGSDDVSAAEGGKTPGSGGLDESEEKYEQRYKTLQGILRHDREAWELEKAQQEAKTAQLLEELEQLRVTTSASSSEKSAAVEAFVDSLTDEQKAQLDEYEKDFEVVSQMEGLKRNIERNKLRKELDDWKKDIMSKLEAQITPFTTRINEKDEEAHFEYIKSRHEDYEAYVEDGSLMEWINSKPKYMRPSLLEVYNKGVQEDVVELFSDFKRETGVGTRQQDTGDVLHKKERKKLALTSVVTRHGAINTATGVAQDYDAAFDEAVNKN